MARKIKAGVIGAGIGKYHIEGYLKSGKADVVAICDSAEGVAQALIDKYGLNGACVPFTNHKSMLQQMSQLDCVSVCVPNKWHMPLCLDVMNAGKHVLCEKPLARNAAEGQKMVDAAAKNKVKFMIQFNNRYRPEAQLLKQYAEAGDLGDFYFARCGWIRRNGIPGWGNWFTSKEMAGGGPLIDLAVHMLDLTMWLMGNPEPEIVMASTYQKFGPMMKCLGPWGTPNTKGKYDVEDMAVGMLKFKNGATILLEASWASCCEREWVWSTLMGDVAGATLERVFEVDGIDDTSVDTLKMFTTDHGGPVDRRLIVEPDPAMGRHNAVKHFVDCLTDASVKMISPATDGQRIMKILDAMYKSAETGKAVNVK